MGLGSAVGAKARDIGPSGQLPGERVIALAGNPNVGKSTLFNALTGMNQHTGNWPGKTVSSAQGRFSIGRDTHLLIDLPGTYSLMAHSAEEEIARDFICFQKPDLVIAVCDGTCLERNLNLVLQTLELTSHVVVCVNLMDQARRRGIRLDLPKLSRLLGVPVVGVSARNKRSLHDLLQTVDQALQAPPSPKPVPYPAPLEAAIAKITPLVEHCGLPPRWLALRLLEQDEALAKTLRQQTGVALEDPALAHCLSQARQELEGQGFGALSDAIVSSLVSRAEDLARQVSSSGDGAYSPLDHRLDRVLTAKATGFPIMLLMLLLIFWLTMTGANYPSAWLSALFNWTEGRLTLFFAAIHAPDWLYGVVVQGAWRVLGWVVAVMLPPMAIFFPLFTLLEDVGFLPRIAYNLDRPFQACRACGKQALTM